MDTKDQDLRVLVDWYSFTVPIDESLTTALEFAAMFTDETRRHISHSLFKEIFECDGWEYGSGRRPYPVGYSNRDKGIFVWFGKQNHALVEFSGTGCEFLRQKGLLLQLMKSTAERVTRIDIAIDYRTEKTPSEIVSQIPKGRFKATSSVKSESGETEYLGSKKSDRYARIYRYSEPHPRHEWLRTEFVVRKPHAQVAIENTLAHGVSYAAQMLANTFKVNEVMPRLDNVDETLPAVRNDRKESKTVTWLIKQAAPAFRKLVQSGVIQNPDDFLDTYFRQGEPSVRQRSIFEDLNHEDD